jgi:hypothetical protein
MYRSFLMLTALTLFACTPDEGPEAADLVEQTARHAADGTPEGIGLLDFLNSSRATQDVLDYDVPLEARAARGLARKSGSFVSVQDVDDVKYVGPSAMFHLNTYVLAEGYVPEGGDLLGVFDDVAFTVDEANAVVDLVNNASRTELDDDAGLDRRAVDSIFAESNIPTVLALSDLYYVGRSALKKLRDHVNIVPEGLALGEDCIDRSECQDGLTCYGKVNDGSTEYGKCVDMDQGADEHKDCDTDLDCGTGTVCMGDEAWNGMFCVNAWQEGTFSVNESIDIPDNGSLESHVIVYGLATVPIDVLLFLDIDHPEPTSLTYQMINFNGYESNPKPVTAELAAGGKIVIRSFPSDDYVNGTYSLVITDTKSGGAGVLNGWDVRVTSTFD